MHRVPGIRFPGNPGSAGKPETGRHVHRRGDVQPPHLAGLQDQAPDPGGAGTPGRRPEAVQNTWNQLAPPSRTATPSCSAWPKQITLYNQGIVPQARQAAAASLSSYQVGSLAFDRLYQNQIAVYSAELTMQEYLKDFEENWAELEWLVGAELPRPAGGKQMSPASRGKGWWGLGLPGPGHPGVIAMFPASCPCPRPAKAEGPVLCLAQEPQLHQGGPGQGPRRQRTGAGLSHPGRGQPPPRPRGGPHRQAEAQDQVLALPHASGNRPGQARQMPHLRHGPGAGL